MLSTAEEDPEGGGGTERRVRNGGDETTPDVRWTSWLIPMVVTANVVVFISVMYVNDCPHNSHRCLAKFLGRFSFESFKKNPLIGPSSSTWVIPSFAYELGFIVSLRFKLSKF